MKSLTRNFFGNLKRNTKTETTPIPKVAPVSGDEKIQYTSGEIAKLNTEQEAIPKDMTVTPDEALSKGDTLSQGEEGNTGKNELKELDKMPNNEESQENTSNKEETYSTAQGKEVELSTDEKMSNENSGLDTKPDTQNTKADETKSPDGSESDYEKNRYVKQVEREYLNQLTELAKQASKQVLNEAVDTIIENLMYPKILKNLDDAFVELSIKQKVDDLIEERVNSYLSKELNSILPEMVNQKVQEEAESIISKYVEIQVSTITEMYCKNKFAEKFDEEIRKYLNQHQVDVDYLENYKHLYIDISKLVKLIDDTNLEESKQTELENLLNNMLAKVLFQRERWIKKEENKKLEGTGTNDDTAKEES